ncbi:MAG TPA: RsmE family RNA methyltransferase [Bryobacteraceae bacterium]|jgi:16S rRNA (uracil1498-N3)-methyltransferase
MARRRFFVSEVRNGVAELHGEEAEHLVRVLRAEVGQVYEISDNQQLYLAEVEVARKTLLSFKILEKLPEPEATVEILLAAALIKFDRFEWLVEKATELGVTAIQPFEAVRTERGLSQAALKRRARWEKIALEASQQSRRLRLPELLPAARFGEVVAMDANIKLLLDENAGGTPILQCLPAAKIVTDRVALMLGPEGGWTEAERTQAVVAGWKPCSLGKTILRTETAAVAGLAVIHAAWAATIS